jgi:hypothetical protein
VCLRLPLTFGSKCMKEPVKFSISQCNHVPANWKIEEWDRRFSEGQDFPHLFEVFISALGSAQTHAYWVRKVFSLRGKAVVT